MQLSLPAYFRTTYGELLAPRGFHLLKSKYPYFVRVTSDGIVQSVSFAKEKATFHPDSYEGFSIWIGLSLISLPLTDYNTKPSTLDNQTWMMPLVDFFHRCSLYLDEFEEQHEHFSFFYKKEDSEEMLNALNQSQKELMPFVLDFFERYTTMADMYQFKDQRFIGFYADVVVLEQRIDEYWAEREKEFPKQFENAVRVLENNPLMRSMRERKKKELLDSFEREKQWLFDRKAGGCAYEEYMENAAKTKKNNLQLLADMGSTF